MGKELFVHRDREPHCAALCKGPVGWQGEATSLLDTDLFEVSRNKLSLRAQLIVKMLTIASIRCELCCSPFIPLFICHSSIHSIHLRLIEVGKPELSELCIFIF